MLSSSRKPFTIVLLSFLFLLSGCSGEDIKNRTVEKLKWLDEKLGREAPAEEEAEPPREEKDEEIDASDLTPEEKEKIDQWLEEKGLNRYGDSRQAIYPGGTPLYNEKTGESINRFDYILDRYPDILERINNNGDQSP